MLASVKEGYSGCSQYFPSNEGDTITCNGGWIITYVKTHTPAKIDKEAAAAAEAAAAVAQPEQAAEAATAEAVTPFNFRMLEITRPAEMGGGTRSVAHCQYNNWSVAITLPVQ